MHLLMGRGFREPQPSKSGGEYRLRLQLVAQLAAIDLGLGVLPRQCSGLPRKEVIQPHLPVRLPCYDFVPIAGPALDGCPLAVGPPASGVSNFHDVTGGVYKARERIHRSVLTCGY
jgi:hypothetical protein